MRETYTLLYHDGRNETYKAGRKKLEMFVENSSPPQIYPVGVKVLEKFEMINGFVEKGWYSGNITDYDINQDLYQIIWQGGIIDF